MPAAGLHGNDSSSKTSSVTFHPMMLFLVLVTAHLTCVAGAPTLYDQRQTGDSNVRVDIQDVVVIEMDSGSLGGDYEYNYDYSDLTVKPEGPNLTSTTPTSNITTATSTQAPPPGIAHNNTTGAPDVSSSSNLSPGPAPNSTIVLEKENQTLTITPIKPSSNSSSSEPNKISLVHPLNTHNLQIPVMIVQEDEVKKPEKTYVSSSVIRRKPAAELQDVQDVPRHCAQGFFLDNRNRCKRIKRPLRDRPQLPYGLRFPQRIEDLMKKTTETKATETT